MDFLLGLAAGAVLPLPRLLQSRAFQASASERSQYTSMEYLRVWSVLEESAYTIRESRNDCKSRSGKTGLDAVR